jgi:hypothetical protein
MLPQPLSLTFDLLDDLLLARERGRLARVTLEPGTNIGPQIELVVVGGSLNGIAVPSTPALGAAKETVRTRRPAYRDERRVGVVAAQRMPHQGEDLHRDAFMFEMHKAMRRLDWPTSFSAGFVDAMGEMESNIHEHSGAVSTGVMAYRVTAHEVEWVVADRGIGILRGLQEGVYPSLTDAGEALRIALTDGCSRSGMAGRGNGFRPLFKALSARRGRLRFRSDDQLLTIEGVSPSLSRSRLDQRAQVSGFAVSVVCGRSR